MRKLCIEIHVFKVGEGFSKTFDSKVIEPLGKPQYLEYHLRVITQKLWIKQTLLSLYSYTSLKEDTQRWEKEVGMRVGGSGVGERSY